MDEPVNHSCGDVIAYLRGDWVREIESRQGIGFLKKENHE
jgi:hypothetical protein